MTLKLYIQPKTILFAARVNEPDAVTYPRDHVTFDTITTGTTGVVGPSQTVLIGSTAGGHDLGITRIRKDPTSSVLYIGRSSQGVRLGEVTLTDNAYISVLNEARVWSKVPYIDDDGVTFMDSDLDFASYGADSPPVANAGIAAAGTIDSGTGLLTVNFSASNSFVTMPGASIASYAWNVGAGTITVGTSASEDITATFPAGLHMVTLLVADDNAEAHTAYVPVLAIDPASDPTIDAFEIQSHRITQAGQELRVRIREDIDEATYLDGAYCLLLSGDEPSDGDDRSNVLFRGWIQISDEQLRATATGLLRDVTLTLVDVAGRLRDLPGYSTVIEHVASPVNWQEMATPDMGRYLHYLLQWGSTALDVADFTLAGDEDDYTFKILASDGGTLFEQVNRRAEALIPDHKFTCNRAGQLAIGTDPMLQATGDRTASVQATLTAATYQESSYQQRRTPRYSWVRANSIIAGTDAVTTAFCIAPGTAPGQGPQTLNDGEHLSLSQADLNLTTGHRYARMNAPQGPFSIVLAEGNDYALDPAALTWLQITVDSTVAAQRGLTFTEARFLMQRLDIRYQHAREGLTKTVTITAERETTDGVAAITEVIPAAEPVQDGGWVPVVPDEQFFNNYLTPATERLAAIDTNGYIFTTDDWLSGSPTWSRNTSAAGAVSIGLNDLMSFVVDPFSPLYRGTGSTVNGWVHDEFSVYRVTDIFGTPVYTAQKTFADHCNRLRGEWSVIAASFGEFFGTETDNPWLMSVRAQNGIGTGGTDGVYVCYSVDAGQTWSSEIQVTAHSDSSTAYSPMRIAGVHLSPRTPGYALLGVYTSTGNPAATDIYETTDWGATWASAGIASDMGDGLGYCFHVPWEDNADESLLYYTNFDKNSNAFKWSLRRTDGTTDTGISANYSSKTYAPFRQLFGIRSLDTDRLQMVMAAEANESNAIEITLTNTDAEAGIWTSTDGGDNWTLRYTPVTGGTTADVPMQVAFASGDAAKIYGWGLGGLLLWSDDGGANWTDKTPNDGGGWSAAVEMIGICGG